MLRLESAARAVPLACLALAVGLAWWYLAEMAREVAAGGTFAALGPGMGWLDAALAHGGVPAHGAGSAGHVHAAHAGLGSIALMWGVMVVAMMLPVAAPMIATHAGIARRARERGAAPSPGIAFVGGYLLVWGALCAVAAPLQWWLQHVGLMSAQMAGASDRFAGAVLVAAGLFQFSSLKHACLHRCRTPLQFFLTRWRTGWRGALSMGAAHGLFCVGCCWALMALMLALGAMNLVWIGLLALLMGVERMASRGVEVARVAGVGFVVWGVALLAGAVG